MKLLSILIVLIFNSTSTLTWSDFRGHVPDDEQTVAARTYTALTLQTNDSDGIFTCHVSAEFLNNLSWVRIRSEKVLSHETTHWRICLLYEAICNKALAKFQGKRLLSMKPVAKIYEYYQRQIDLLNEQFDRESSHGNNAVIEARYEKRISNDLNTELRLN